MNEKNKRLEKLHAALEVIVRAPPQAPLANLVDPNRVIFEGLEVIYSTDNTESQLAGIGAISNIGRRCAVVDTYFYGSGVYFFTDNIYDRTMSEGAVEIPIDYAFFLDSNTAENFRIFQKRGSLSNNESNFRDLLTLLYGGQGGGLKMNFSFFILENLRSAQLPDNERPKKTIEAIKKIEGLDLSSISEDLRDYRSIADAHDFSQESAQLITSFSQNVEVQKMLLNRKALYLVLLQLLYTYHAGGKSREQIFSDVLDFVLNKVGKFAKLEMYVVWKFLMSGCDLKFFSPMRQLGEKTLRQVSGMSWDLYFMRFSESMLGNNENAEFFVPFFATFDGKFRDFSKACPVKAVILDRSINRVHTVFVDELQFFAYLTSVTGNELQRTLARTQNKAERMDSAVNESRIDEATRNLEADIKSLSDSE